MPPKETSRYTLLAPGPSRAQLATLATLGYAFALKADTVVMAASGTYAVTGCRPVALPTSVCKQGVRFSSTPRP